MLEASVFKIRAEGGLVVLGEDWLWAQEDFVFVFCVSDSEALSSLDARGEAGEWLREFFGIADCGSLARRDSFFIQSLPGHCVVDS